MNGQVVENCRSSRSIKISYYKCIVIIIIKRCTFHVGPVHGPRRCWIPVLTNQLSDSTTAYASMDGQSSSADEEREPMLPENHQSVDIPLFRLRGQQQTAAALASIPAIALKAAGLELDAEGAQRPRRPSTLRRQNSNVSDREVMFDETVL